VIIEELKIANQTKPFNLEAFKTLYTNKTKFLKILLSHCIQTLAW